MALSPIVSSRKAVAWVAGLLALCGLLGRTDPSTQRIHLSVSAIPDLAKDGTEEWPKSAINVTWTHEDRAFTTSQVEEFRRAVAEAPKDFDPISIGSTACT